VVCVYVCLTLQQAVTGVMVDVPKLDTARTGRTAPVVIKGQDELVRKSKALFEAIGKGVLLRWVWVAVSMSAVGRLRDECAGCDCRLQANL
jgi:hypothetical protein